MVNYRLISLALTPLALQKKYGQERLEKTCYIALNYNTPDRRFIGNLLHHHRENRELRMIAENAPDLRRTTVRGETDAALVDGDLLSRKTCCMARLRKNAGLKY